MVPNTYFKEALRILWIKIWNFLKIGEWCGILLLFKDTIWIWEHIFHLPLPSCMSLLLLFKKFLILNQHCFIIRLELDCSLEAFDCFFKVLSPDHGNMLMVVCLNCIFIMVNGLITILDCFWVFFIFVQYHSGVLSKHYSELGGLFKIAFGFYPI